MKTQGPVLASLTMERIFPQDVILAGKARPAA